MDGNQHIDELIAALAHTNSIAGQQASRKLQAIGSDAVLPLIHALKHENANIAAQAALLLSGFEDTRTIEPLKESMKDTRAWVAHWSVFSLGRVGKEEVVDILIDALKDQRTQRAAAEALGDLRSEKALEPLIASLYAEAEATFASEREEESPEDIKDWQRADFFSRPHIRALANIGSIKAIPSLIEALQSRDLKIFDPAFHGLRTLGTSAVEALIAGFQKSNNPNYRDHLIQLLGEIGDSRAFDTIVHALGDDDILVRQTAADALGDLKDKRAISHLTPFLNDPDEWMRKAVREALIELGHDPDANS